MFSGIDDECSIGTLYLDNFEQKGERLYVISVVAKLYCVVSEITL